MQQRICLRCRKPAFAKNASRHPQRMEYCILFSAILQQTLNFLGCRLSFKEAPDPHNRFHPMFRTAQLLMRLHAAKNNNQLISS